MRICALIIGVTLIGACAAPSPPPAPATWEATLGGQPDFAGVTGAAVAEVRTGRMAVTASLACAAAGATHPWHVHYGTCANDEGIVGEAGDYPPMQPEAGGDASASATVGVPLEAGGDYFVNVHASPDDLETIVACGELAPR